VYSQGPNLALGIWIALLLCFAVGWVVNKIAKRPLMNWAGWLAGWYVLAFVASEVALMNRPMDGDLSFLHGRYIGTYLLPAVLAFLYSRRWRKRNPSSGSSASQPPPSGGESQVL
jgi:hypothetical protein